MQDGAASISIRLEQIQAGRDVQVITGVPPEQLEALVRDRTKPLQELADAQKELLAALKQRLDLNEAQVRAALETAGRTGVPPERIAQTLVEIAGEYKKLLAQVRAGPGDDPRVAELKTAANEALQNGDRDRAKALLLEARKAQAEDLDRRALDYAATNAQLGGIALTELRYCEAADYFAEAAGRVPPGYEEERLGYLDREADALYRQGEEKGDNAALTAAVARYGVLARLRTRERAPLDWANTNGPSS